MSYYSGDVFRVTRKLDGKGRLQLPGDFREAVGFAPDEVVEISAIRLMEQGIPALMITRKESGK